MARDSGTQRRRWLAGLQRRFRLPETDGSLPSRSVAESRVSDRVLGLICLALAFWYVAETRNFQITQFGSGPVGPKTMPTLVGILFAGLALVLLVKPDPSPRWPSFAVAWRLTVVTGVSFLFGQLLEPVGFIIAAVAMSIIIGIFFDAPLVKLVPLSIAFAVVLAFVFNNWLELRLPPGWWGGF